MALATGFSASRNLRQRRRLAPNGTHFASDVVSRKALAAGFAGENVIPICRWLAPFRSK